MPSFQKQPESVQIEEQENLNAEMALIAAIKAKSYTAAAHQEEESFLTAIAEAKVRAEVEEEFDR